MTGSRDRQPSQASSARMLPPTAHAVYRARVGSARTVASGIAWTLMSQNLGSRKMGSVSADATIPGDW